jgi:fructoselysine-6-P-deglycase FrlB-like protein
MSLHRFFEDIQEQPEVFQNHLDTFRSIINTTSQIQFNNNSNCIFTGIATSYYAWEAAALSLRKVGVSRGELIDTSDLLDYSLPMDQDQRPVFVLSRSGESAEIVRLSQSIPAGRLLVGISENKSSPLAKRADHVFEFVAMEKTYPNTKSFTLSMGCTLAVSIGAGLHIPLGVDEWVRVTTNAMDAMLLDWQGAEDIAALLSSPSSLLVNGQGYLSGVAKQACLDFQEIRVLAIPVTGNVFRHGTIELTQRPDITVVVLVPNDPTVQRRLELIYDLYDQRTPVAAVISGSTVVDRPIPLIRVPSVQEELQPFLFALAMHQIYYSTAKLRGLESIQPALVGKVTRKE